MHLEEFIERLERGVRLAENRLALGFRLDFTRNILVWWFEGQEPDVRREFSATFDAVARLVGEPEIDRLLVGMFEDEVRRLRDLLSRIRAERGDRQTGGGFEREAEADEGRGLGL